MGYKHWIVTGLLVVTLPGVALAQNARQTAAVERTLRQAEQQYQLFANTSLSVGERAVIEYGGLLTFALMAIDDNDGQTHMLRQTDAQFVGRLDLDGVHQVFGRLRYTYSDYNHGDDFDGRGDGYDTPIGDRWWYQFDLRRAIETSAGESPEYNLTAKVGRQFVSWGSGLVFSDQLYAVKATGEWGDIRIDGLIGETPNSSVIDFDPSRPSFDSDTDRRFFGGMLTYTGFDEHRPYIYVMDQQDRNGEDHAVVAGFDTRFNYDSTYFGIGSSGTLIPRLHYSVEFVYETGQGLSDPADPNNVVPGQQFEEDINAWAGKVNLTYLFRDQNHTRLEFETLLASGDDDRQLDTSATLGGNAGGTDDNAFNAFGFAKTGLAFAAPLSNLIANRVGVSTFPMPGHQWLRQFQVGMDLMVFNKMDKNGPIDEPTDNGRYLGLETDVFINWRIFSDTTVNFRYGAFLPGHAIVGNDSVRHFGYAGISYSF